MLSYAIVDALTDTLLGGNDSSVLVLVHSRLARLSDNVLQSMARELNFPMTVFAFPKPGCIERGKYVFGVRPFNPTKGGIVCGHGALALAHALFSDTDLVPPDVRRIKLTQKRGTIRVSASRKDDGRTQVILPAEEVEEVDPSMLEKARAAVVRVFGRDILVSASHVPGEPYLLLEVHSEFDLENAEPEPSVFDELAGDYELFVVTNRYGVEGPRFISRVFTAIEDVGITEVAACGFAHCLLGPYWHKKLDLLPRAIMHARQVGERSAAVDVIWNEERGFCKLRGHAVIAAEGQMMAD